MRITTSSYLVGIMVLLGYRNIRLTLDYMYDPDTVDPATLDWFALSITMVVIPPAIMSAIVS